MDRRTFLQYATVSSATILGGCSQAESALFGNQKENMLETTITNHPLFPKLVFFESGAAEIYMSENHGAERLAFSHYLGELGQAPLRKPADAYEMWDAPEFEGPITVDMKDAIQSNRSYPSRRFKLKTYPEKGSVDFTLNRNRTVSFTVPEAYSPQ